jgi:hypothetical protein
MVAFAGMRSLRELAPCAALTGNNAPGGPRAMFCFAQ